jgi:RNA polymerase sigma-70 factor (ECF subfamily)
MGDLPSVPAPRDGAPPDHASVGQEAFEEEQLVTGLLAGRTEAIARFLGRTHHPVFCMAGRLTRSSEQRRDWSHEVLLGILEDMRRGRFAYTRPGSFWAWFRKRAYYRLLDLLRQERRRGERESTTDACGEARDLDLFTGGEDPLAELERAETLHAIEQCLDKLPNAEQRHAVTLLLLEEMDYQAIAAALGAPLNTVKTWIRRGRIAVRRCLTVALHLEGPAGATPEAAEPS